MWKLWRKRRDYSSQMKDRIESIDSRLQSRTRKFTYKELVTITSNFSQQITGGGFESTFHGFLIDGTEVAVKMRRGTESGPDDDLFLKEAQLLSGLHHENVISLAGYCSDRNHVAIVYNYMPQRCLRDMLDKSHRTLSWAERLQIAIDVAQGLDYLLNSNAEPIVHRDVKTLNILLGEKLEAKLWDFGAAKVLHNFIETDQSETTVICGTLGYIDPEYMLCGRVSLQTDVYSFGVVLLEIITARRAIVVGETEREHIAIHTRFCIAGGASVDDIADPRLQGKYDAKSVRMVIDLAMRCTSVKSERPTIIEVVMHLRKSLAIETAHESSKNLYSENVGTNSSHNTSSSPEAARKRIFDSRQPIVDNQDAKLPFVNHQSGMDHEDGRLPFESHQFTYAELEGITKKFAESLGGGGFGTVFSGSLENGTKVAVKRLSPISKQGPNEFLAEVSSLSQVRHRNLVSLVGYCNDRTCMALIYEYMPQGNLEDHLIGRTALGRALNWAERLQIALDAARGLDYLHNGLREPIIHRDVKTSNILLSENLEGKVSDFGLSKTFDRNLQTHVTADCAFTPGYLDPECFNLCRFSEKTDVYSFGVVLLEIITGERPILCLGEVVHIVDCVELTLKRGNICDIADARMKGEYDVRSAWKVVELAMGCTRRASIQRPTMTEVVVQLKECLALETARAQIADASSRNIDNGSTDSAMFMTASRAGASSRNIDNGSTDSTMFMTASRAFDSSTR